MSAKIRPVKQVDGNNEVIELTYAIVDNRRLLFSKLGNNDEATALTIKVYSKPAFQPSVSSILEKYRIPVHHKTAPSLTDGVVSSFDLFGVSKPKTKLPPLRSRRNSKMREFLKRLAAIGRKAADEARISVEPQ